MLWRSDQPANPACSVLEQTMSVDMETNHTDRIWGDLVLADGQFLNLVMKEANKCKNGIFFNIWKIAKAKILMWESSFLLQWIGNYPKLILLVLKVKIGPILPC